MNLDECHDYNKNFKAIETFRVTKFVKRDVGGNLGKIQSMFENILKLDREVACQIFLL